MEVIQCLFFSVRPVLSLGMGDLLPFAPLVGLSLGDLRPFCPGPVPPCVMSPAPFLPPVFARFRKFSPVPGSRPRGLLFRPDQKTKKFSPRRRAAQPFAPPGQKTFVCSKKPLCIVHNGFFLYPSPNAFSYSSIRRFSSAQYRASSSDMSSRLLFCSIARPTLSAPARSLLIRW